MRPNAIRSPREDKIFYALSVTLLSLIFLVVLYPLIFILSASFSDARDVLTGRVWLFPVRLSLDGYKTVFEYADVWTGYGNSLFYAVVGTAVNVAMTMLAAYPLSRKDFVGRNTIMFLFTFTLFFSGGLIPTYILIRSLGLLDKRAVMIVPWALSVWNLIIARTYLQSNIPKELYDAARVDGASNTRTLLMVVLPLSGPIIAVLTLFYAVGHWNAFFNALIFLKRRSLMPLQIILREVLIMNSPVIMDKMMSGMTARQLEQMTKREYLVALLQYSLIIVASAPVLIAYPFVQKYFVRGVMVGAIKG